MTRDEPSLLSIYCHIAQITLKQNLTIVYHERVFHYIYMQVTIVFYKAGNSVNLEAIELEALILVSTMT